MYGESLMLVNPRKTSKRSMLGKLGMGGKLTRGVTIYDAATGAAGAVVVLVLPKMAPSGWGYGIKGVMTSALVTVAAGAVTYMATKNNRYAYAVVLGGAIITGLRALKVITKTAGVRPIGLEGAEMAGLGQIPEEELLTGIDAYRSDDSVKVL